MYGYEDYAVDSVGMFGAMAAGVGIMWIFSLIIMLIVIISMWKIFSKAGRPGWAAIVPIYNVITLLDVAGYEWWYLILLLIPIVNIIILFKVYIGLANNFGKSAGFGVGLVLFNVIFMPILAFGSSEYEG